MAKEAAAGAKVASAVIAGTALGIDVLHKLMGVVESDRKIAIGVCNETKEAWTGKNVYLDRTTTSTFIMAEKVEPGEAFLYRAKKVGLVPISGIAGVVAYEMNDGNTLAVMFSVPYNYTIFDNWWNAKVYNGKQQADKAMFEELYSSEANPIKGDNAWRENDIGEGYKAKGFMSDAAAAPLLIHVTEC